MNRYHLEVIIGGEYTTIERVVDADRFDYSSAGVYAFYKIIGKNDNGSNRTEFIAAYPINKTIIKSIQKL